MTLIGSSPRSCVIDTSRTPALRSRLLAEHLDVEPARVEAEIEAGRSVLAAMAADEAAHGTNAEALGGKPLPTLIKTAMKWTARIMTRTSFWL